MSILWFVSDLRNKIKSFLFPQQRWLKKVIPNAWCDKTELIPTVLYECLKHYVEKEDCFNAVDWEYSQTYRDVAKDIKDCYKWITVNRPKLVAEIDKIICDAYNSKSFENLRNPIGSFNDRYPNLDNKELELETKDTHYLCLIVKHRRYLWT